MLKVAFVIYRKWGFDIFKSICEYQKLRGDFEVCALITNKKPEFIISPSLRKEVRIYKVDPNDQKEIFGILNKHKVKIVFLYSWSYIIKKEILDKFICLCLHPSILPLNRGGTPIQHQLINGEINSGITIFKMSEKIDAGDIYRQAVMSMIGDVNDIFSRMANLGIILTKDIVTDHINGELVFRPQKNLKDSQVLKRRKPDQSEIFIKDFRKTNYDKVYNLVRGLLDPYPNVFIKTRDYIIYIQEIVKYKFLPKKSVIIGEDTDIRSLDDKQIFLHLKDSYARLVKYKIIRISES